MPSVQCPAVIIIKHSESLPYDDPKGRASGVVEVQEGIDLLGLGSLTMQMVPCSVTSPSMLSMVLFLERMLRHL